MIIWPNLSFHLDRAGLGIYWKVYTGLSFGGFLKAFLVTRPASEAKR